ncbi:hypothetical protein AC579_4372 [Pseudocercospora musae]|uniref:Uncharacterized protein n=1 Tax=Pseudocercospora musae TaxID=113226 RepID=A0A139IQK0_9PEZI|nr:hypothetical protein AC579_4372 [Pseudocercospora musae]
MIADNCKDAFLNISADAHEDGSRGCFVERETEQSPRMQGAQDEADKKDASPEETPERKTYEPSKKRESVSVSRQQRSSDAARPYQLDGKEHPSWPERLVPETIVLIEDERKH